MSPKFVGNENIKSNSNTENVNNHNGNGNDNDDDGIHIQNCLWTKTLAHTHMKVRQSLLNPIKMCSRSSNFIL